MVIAKNTLQGTVSGQNSLSGNVSIPPGSGANYEGLRNLPKINGVTLIGDLSLEALGIIPLTNEEIDNLLN